MTAMQRLRREITKLLQEKVQEVLDFVLFVNRNREAQAYSQEEEQKRTQWKASLPELRLSKRAQRSLAQARTEQGIEMTIQEFQNYLDQADV